MRLNGLTVAVTAMGPMVDFYNSVFAAELSPVPSSPFFRGTLAGLEVLFCPNTIAEVKAEKNRIQLRIAVSNIHRVVGRALASGGGDYGDHQENETRIVHGISDPDGNSIELIQSKEPS